MVKPVDLRFGTAARPRTTMTMPIPNSLRMIDLEARGPDTADFEKCLLTTFESKSDNGCDGSNDSFN